MWALLLARAWNAYSCQIDACLSFMRRIVADPQQSIVPNQTGVTGVATGGKFERFGQRRVLGVQPRQRCPRTTIVKSRDGKNSAIW